MKTLQIKINDELAVKINTVFNKDQDALSKLAEGLLSDKLLPKVTKAPVKKKEKKDGK